MKTSDTFFLPAERSSSGELKTEKKIIESISYVKEIINALAGVVLILNKNRQTIFSNKFLLKKIGLYEAEMLVGLRPGEILKCIHSAETKGGCGTTESCRYCGAALVIKKCFEKRKVAETECRIISNESEKISALDYRVTASPVNIKGSFYCILSIADISDEKRRKILERIFIHDIINISGGLKGMINHLIRLNNLKNDSDGEVVLSGINDLVEEIISQRELLAAENNEIKVRQDRIVAGSFIKEIIGIIKNHPISEDKKISLTVKPKIIEFISDKVLLKRVLINMLKNAMEASVDGSVIKIITEGKNNKLLISVNNPGVMTKEVQMQIFQRSFSTKDIRRGLGTYSIKLFTENYLKGKVHFTSNPSTGTTFYITLPREDRRN